VSLSNVPPQRPQTAIQPTKRFTRAFMVQTARRRWFVRIHGGFMFLLAEPSIT
jgi:hypothetical protein